MVDEHAVAAAAHEERDVQVADRGRQPARRIARPGDEPLAALVERPELLAQAVHPLVRRQAERLVEGGATLAVAGEAEGQDERNPQQGIVLRWAEERAAGGVL